MTLQGAIRAMATPRGAFLASVLLFLCGLSLWLDIALQPRPRGPAYFLAAIHVLAGLFWGYVIWRFLAWRRRKTAP